MSIFLWYKNAALIEKQHPMVAGFFRLKDRKARRPGYAIDSIPVRAAAPDENARSRKKIVTACVPCSTRCSELEGCMS